MLYQNFNYILVHLYKYLFNILLAAFLCYSLLICSLRLRLLPARKIVLTCIPTLSVWKCPNFFISLPTLFIICLFIINILVGWNLHFVVLICTSFMINDVEHLSMCSLAICISSMEKCILRSLPIFLLELCIF